MNPGAPSSPHRLAALTAGFFTAFSAAMLAGPKGEIIVRQLGDIRITIDGDFSDWPLDKFEEVSEQPLFPEGQTAQTTSARGDHIVFDRDRIGRFNGTAPDAWMANASDFGSTVYFAYNDQFLYMLAVTIDDIFRADRDTTEFGTQGFLNDGFEFFLDTRGNSADCATDIAFPDFDQEEPNVDDFQVTVGVNENFKPEGSAAEILGARQTVERGGDPDLRGPDKGGPGGIYRDALDAAPGADIAARSYDDLRSAGARNPEIASNPDILFTGYAVEMRVPFGCVTAFTPDHNMGFELFWRDVDKDDDPGAGGGMISWAAWTQSTNVGCDDPATALFQTSNWAEWIFDTSNPLGKGGGAPGGASSISISAAGDQITLEWTGNLERAEDVTGPWVPVTGSSPRQVTVAKGIRFYRALPSDTASTAPAPLFEDDFESGAAGWFHKAAAAGKRDPWELGTPAGDLSPKGAASGTQAWGTNLAGSYPDESDALLRTPPIDLSGQSAATLVFNEYLDVEGLDADGFVLDEVKVNVLDASNRDGPPLAKEIRQRVGSVRGWLRRKVVLPQAALGREVVIEFRFVSDTFNDPPQGGWYLDDVSVIPE